MKTKSILSAGRAEFHKALLMGILTKDSAGIPNIADKGSDVSKSISIQLLDKMGSAQTQSKAAGQTSGKQFEEAVSDFLSNTFLKLEHLRPGDSVVRDRRSGYAMEISNFEQYEHLAKLMKMIQSDPAIACALGADYLITPDLVILRRAETDVFLNKSKTIVDNETALLTSIRKRNRPDHNLHPKTTKNQYETVLLHASISCKWTLRSDRAQNARSEALNLIRNRKGRVPHIVAITAEPLPSRLASLALGTSDLDCVYHIALPELIKAVAECSKNHEYSKELETLIIGKRLRDISDLPLDLII